MLFIYYKHTKRLEYTQADPNPSINHERKNNITWKYPYQNFHKGGEYVD